MRAKICDPHFIELIRYLCSLDGYFTFGQNIPRIIITSPLKKLLSIFTVLTQDIPSVVWSEMGMEIGISD